MKILLFLLLISCQRKSYITEEDPFTYTIKIVKHSLSDLRVVPWYVGKTRKVKISRGFKLLIHPPLFSGDVLEKLEKFNITSWIVKIEKISTTGDKTLDMFSFNLGHGRRQVKTISFNIYYAASSLSKRLDHVPCPVLSHDKKITNLELESEKFTNLMTIYKKEAKNVYAKVRPWSLPEISVNGGMSLNGNYKLSIALYSQSENKIYSSFVPFKEIVKVNNEESYTLPGC